MNYQLLLVDGEGRGVTAALRVRMLREFPGCEGVSVHFRPVRNDVLFESARGGGELGYRILRGEGIVRSQLAVEYAVDGAQHSVMGRSSDLLFALALITATWKLGSSTAQVIAATGILATDGTVQRVDHTAAKVAAAVAAVERRDQQTPALIFYPATDSAAVAAWSAGAKIHPQIRLCPVGHLDDALAQLGYTLEKVYLRNPFRGLEHFDYADHAIFFGRDTEVRDLVELLLRREEARAPGLLVEGASGSGKSSFLRAGVLPALVEPRFQPPAVQQALRERRVSVGVGRAIWWPGLVPAPGDEAAIAQSIIDVWSGFPEFGSDWQTAAVTTLAQLADMRRERWPAQMRFVWLIDQFEELLVRGLPEATIAAFGRFLQVLQADGVWTLASIRADAMPLMKRQEALRSVFGANEGQYYLAPLQGTALDAVVTLPARAADLTFEIGADGKSLDQCLREAAYREKHSLPMLQFTLNELYQRRAGTMLTHAAYRELGGLSGSIATTAEAVLQAESGSAEVAPRVFRSLVSVDESGNATRRYAAVSDLSGEEASQRLLQRFIEARLCVTDERGGQAVVAFAHDTLLQTLPALTQWLQRETGLLQTRELAQREAQSWQQHGQSDDWLATADKLAAFETLEAARVVLPVPVRAFIARSRSRVRRARRIKRTAIGVMVLLAGGVVVAAVAFALQSRKAEVASEMTARRGEFLENLLKSADPRGGSKDITVAQLLDGATHQIEGLAKSEPLSAASMLNLIAETDNGLGRYPEGLDADARALELLHAHGGDARIELAQALNIRGEILFNMTQYPEAEPFLRAAIKLADGQRGAERVLADALNTLGIALDEQSRLPEAESLYRRSLEACRRLGPTAAGCASNPLNSLGVLRNQQGRDAEAVAYYREALELEKRYLPPDHQDTLATEHNLAQQMAHHHQAAAAEPLFRELLATSLRLLGPDHDNTVNDRLGLAEDLTQQKRYHEAAAEALAALEAINRVAKDEERWAAYGWRYYGMAACLDGQSEAGLTALRRAQELEARQLSATDVHRLYTNVSLGRCLVALQRYAEAEPLLLESVPALVAASSTRSDRTQDGYRALRDLYAATGRTAEAAQWQSKLLPDD